jgi:hypothetical protein
MDRTKYLKGECQHCGGHLEFPVEAAGMAADCPHCGKQTDLLLAPPPEESSGSHKAVVWTVIAVVILALGGAGLWVAWKRAEKWAARQGHTKSVAVTNAAPGGQPAESVVPQDGFSVSVITLEQAAGTSLVYATGTVKNAFDKQRFGVKVELDLLDGAGEKVGVAKDYQQVIEPGGEWRFRALVVEKRARGARVSSIKEEQ